MEGLPTGLLGFMGLAFMAIATAGCHSSSAGGGSIMPDFEPTLLVSVSGNLESASIVGLGGDTLAVAWIESSRISTGGADTWHSQTHVWIGSLDHPERGRTIDNLARDEWGVDLVGWGGSVFAVTKPSLLCRALSWSGSAEPPSTIPLPESGILRATDVRAIAHDSLAVAYELDVSDDQRRQYCELRFAHVGLPGLVSRSELLARFPKPAASNSGLSLLVEGEDASVAASIADSPPSPESSVPVPASGMTGRGITLFVRSAPGDWTRTPITPSTFPAPSGLATIRHSNAINIAEQTAGIALHRWTLDSGSSLIGTIDESVRFRPWPSGSSLRWFGTLDSTAVLGWIHDVQGTLPRSRSNPALYLRSLLTGGDDVAQGQAHLAFVSRGGIGLTIDVGKLARLPAYASVDHIAGVVHNGSLYVAMATNQDSTDASSVGRLFIAKAVLARR